MPPKAVTKTASRAKPRPGFDFGEVSVAAGSRREIEVNVARLVSGSWVSMRVVVCHGARPGPTIWLSGAIHGDELNGVEIVRRLLMKLDPAQLAGTIIAVPVVNVFGVTIESRYLPDRRDLNRSFPGSSRGSLASRLAHLFFERVARRCQFGIDFHTGSDGRANLPQIRCDLDDDTARRCAEAFAAPLVLHSTVRDGSLRAAARKQGIPVLIYEAGEALRFDEVSIQTGVEGTLRVLRSLDMVDAADGYGTTQPQTTHLARSSKWVRTSRSGFCHLHIGLGDVVAKGQCLATVSDSVGRKEDTVPARIAGIVIGVLRTALVHRGDALIHIAEVES